MKKNSIKFPIDEDKIDPSNPNFMYFVGLMATDGYISKDHDRADLRLNDSLITMIAIAHYFDFQGPISKYGKGYEIRLKSKKLIKVLNELGVTSINKTFTVEVPKKFYNKECLRSYLRGVHDGDGNVKRYKHKLCGAYLGGNWRITKGSEKFIKGLIKLINNEFNSELELSYVTRKHAKYPSIVTSKLFGEKFLTWIYKKSGVFKLNYKFSNFKSIIYGRDIVRAYRMENCKK